MLVIDKRYQHPGHALPPMEMIPTSSSFRVYYKPLSGIGVGSHLLLCCAGSRSVWGGYHSGSGGVCGECPSDRYAPDGLLQCGLTILIIGSIARGFRPPGQQRGVDVPAGKAMQKR